jgi:hypothetical protein
MGEGGSGFFRISFFELFYLFNIYINRSLAAFFLVLQSETTEHI